MLFPERLNLHVHARRQIELHQRVDCLLRRLQNIEQPLVGADFKRFPRFARPCVSPSLQSRLSTDPECGSRKPLTECEFFLFQSLFTLFAPPGFSGRKELAAGSKPLLGFHFRNLISYL
jgi:hypothetical protein